MCEPISLSVAAAEAATATAAVATAGSLSTAAIATAAAVDAGMTVAAASAATAATYAGTAVAGAGFFSNLTLASQVMTGVNTATSLLGYGAKQQVASSQAAAVNNNWAQQQATIQEGYRQTQAAATDKISARAREAMIEQSHLRAVSGESGLAGVSVNRTIGESAFNAGTDITAIENNRVNALKQQQLQANGMRSAAQSQINSIQQPSLIGTGLQIAGAVAGGFAEAERLKSITSATKATA